MSSVNECSLEEYKGILSDVLLDACKNHICTECGGLLSERVYSKTDRCRIYKKHTVCNEIKLTKENIISVWTRVVYWDGFDYLKYMYENVKTTEIKEYAQVYMSDFLARNADTNEDKIMWMKYIQGILAKYELVTFRCLYIIYNSRFSTSFDRKAFEAQVEYLNDRRKCL